MGCREWALSGGEPMLRPDFVEIFEHVALSSAWYTLNTNGTLITPAIARLLRRKGTTLVALYGATAGIHDAVTGAGLLRGAWPGRRLSPEAERPSRSRSSP
jgi:MoaA/NifB/PqqE/SkfB family radical SAM enzyme